MGFFLKIVDYFRHIALPIAALVYDAAGQKIAEHAFGNLPRDHRARAL